MPNRWEVRHRLDPDRANAAKDADRDGLRNLAEYRQHGDPRDEDSDDDGDDDGDEAHEHDTDVDDPDSDDDDVDDGDEDHDDDDVDNEDEDDADERCGKDDDDSDEDHVADEDENDHGTDPDDPDSDDDDVPDGDEDHDDDGQHDEDDDDSDEDRCGDDDGEDGDDLVGTIVTFDAETGDLVIDLTDTRSATYVVTDDTEIEYDDDLVEEEDEDAGVEALVPGTVVTEIDLADDGTLEEIELAPTVE